MRFASIDIFCHVIDNFGDIGIVYRFAKEFLLAHPLFRVRVMCDNLRPLSMIRPGVNISTIQEYDGITYVDASMLTETIAQQLGPADIVVEAFGCEIPAAYRKLSLPKAALWINLEYLSAEQWVGGYHLKQSLLADGTTNKYFYMPGFTEDTGGVIVDSHIEKIKPGLVANRTENLNNYLRHFGLHTGTTKGKLFGTVFTYMRGFDTLLGDINNAFSDAYLFVCGEKSQAGMLATLDRKNAGKLGDLHYLDGNTHVFIMPFLPQPEFDALLCLSDFNLVRGEDSLVRAVLAERPFIWSAYLQDNKHHSVKADAFCRVFEQYFDDKEVYEEYRDLFMEFNDTDRENPGQVTGERYHSFFCNLKKIERSTRKMSYFITRKCSLMEKFSVFLAGM
jgi:uncharacterized repeat protein (TIGR03837 family)